MSKCLHVKKLSERLRSAAHHSRRPRVPLPTTSTQLVVPGLTRDLPYTEIPCLGSQWVSYGSKGPWSAATRAGQLSNLGYAEASFAVAAMARNSFRPSMVWNDVEPRPDSHGPFRLFTEASEQCCDLAQPSPLTGGLDGVRVIVLPNPVHRVGTGNSGHHGQQCKSRAGSPDTATADNLNPLPRRPLERLLQRTNSIRARRRHAEVPPLHPVVIPQWVAGGAAQQVDSEV